MNNAKEFCAGLFVMYSIMFGFGSGAAQMMNSDVVCASIILGQAFAFAGLAAICTTVMVVVVLAAWKTAKKRELHRRHKKFLARYMSMEQSQMWNRLASKY